MSDTDDKVTRAYRSLGGEGPPAALDARILAASREALVRPPVSRRWAAPVSIAAVLVLAFGVTLRMQHEQPGVESPDMDATRPARRAPVQAEAPAAPSDAPAAGPKAKQDTNEKSADTFKDRAAAIPAQPAMKQVPFEEARAKKSLAPEAKPQPGEADTKLRDQARMESERKDVRPLAAESMLAKESNVASPMSPAASAAAPAPQAKVQSARAAQATAREAIAAPAAGVAADAQALDEPTRELEAIAKLRAEGRHEDADKAIAEFRRKRPDYRIPDAMWERVKPR